MVSVKHRAFAENDQNYAEIDAFLNMHREEKERREVTLYHSPSTLSFPLLGKKGMIYPGCFVNLSI